MNHFKATHWVLFSVSTIFSFAQNDAPNYADPLNWAVLPTDTQLSWPVEINDPVPDGIDVFYVYPTLLTSKLDRRWNYDLHDRKHRRSVMETAVKFQASAWASCGNLYIPYYRQAHYRSYRKYENGGEEALQRAYADVRSAFQFYLEHYYTGNGIILAGHSQGTTHLSQLLLEYFDGKELQKKLVAAYLPGIGLPEDLYRTIPLLTRADATGGFLTWNTCKRRYNNKNYREWYRGKACINPVSWDTSSFVPRGQHKGFLYSNGKMYRNSFDTHRVSGAIWINVPKFPNRFGAVFMRNYHVGDVNLFWEDIRTNALLRGRRYLEGAH